MNNPLVDALINMIDASDALLLQTELNDLQRKFANSIFTSAIELRDLVIVMDDLTREQAQHIFGFEVRANLSKIIGYAEVLLEETEGTLNPIQRDMAETINRAGHEINDYLNEGN